MRSVDIVLRDGGTTIAVIHESSDPSHWIVRRWKRTFLIRRMVSSEWFIDREQAIRHADGLRLKYQNVTMS